MYGIALLVFVVCGISVWMSKRRARRVLERELGRRVGDQEVTALSTWMRVSPASEPAPVPRPAYALFSPESVAVAAFVGSVLGAGMIVGLNLKRRRGGVLWLSAPLLGFAATIAFAVVGFLSARSFPNIGTLLLFVQVLAPYLLAEVFQGSAFAMHRAAGGAVSAWWKAALVGLAAFAVMALLFIAVGILAMAAKRAA